MIMWKIKEVASENAISELAKSSNIPSTMARILFLRDIKTKADVEKFLNPKFSDLHPYSQLPDIEPAVKRIQQAIKNGEKIVIWGHEDLDGITATIILYETIKAIQGHPFYYIPTKGKDKHGLSTEKAKEFGEQGVKLIITVDCGITNVEEVELIKKLGIDVIITDHHEVLDSVPQSIANIDPKCKNSSYPFEFLAGVGIALKLAIALVDIHLGVKLGELFSLKPDFFGFVALGTISDRVPLVDENRIFTKLGLEELSKIQNPAINAIFSVAGVDKKNVTNDKFFSDILPIFASANGNNACDYFLNKSYDECVIWAQELYRQSQNWREEAKQTLVLAEQIVDVLPGILFVKDERLSLKALGHVAGKLKDRYQVPALIMGPKGDDWVGECRGINGVDLIELLKAHRQYFSAFGGHKKACGFTISKKDADAFIKSAKKFAKEHFAANIIKENKVIPDAILPIKELNNDFKRLGPFGEGNPSPILISPNTPFSKSNGKHIFLERPDIDIRNNSEQQIYDRVFVDVLYTFDENLNVAILKVDYPET
jgi:single-stranded-DNA-specific exonuclease